MTKETKHQFKQEIESILLKNETNYTFDNIYEDVFGAQHIVLKYSTTNFYLDINVSMKRARSYSIDAEGSTFFHYEELKLSLDIINWWYK